MPTKTSILKKILYILLPLALIAVVVIRLKNNKRISQEKVYHYNKEQAQSVQTDTIASETLFAEFMHTGTFEPDRETRISAEIQGKINQIMVDAGSYVSKGQALIQLDNALLKLQLQSVALQIEGLEADVKRYGILAAADAIQGVQLEKAELGLKSAIVQKATLNEQISKTIIRAPFSGIVTAKLSEEGGFAAPGVPLLQISDIAHLKFIVQLSENDLSRFRLNQTCSLYADAYPDLMLNAKVSMVGSKANSGSSFPVQLSLNNSSDLKIKSGMFGKVMLKTDSHKKGFVIASSAISGTAEDSRVYLLKNGRAVLHRVKVSEKFQDKSLVTEGLQAGDVIVVNGFINLFDGAAVIVR